MEIMTDHLVTFRRSRTFVIHFRDFSFVSAFNLATLHQIYWIFFLTSGNCSGVEYDVTIWKFC